MVIPLVLQNKDKNNANSNTSSLTKLKQWQLIVIPLVLQNKEQWQKLMVIPLVLQNKDKNNDRS